LRVESLVNTQRSVDVGLFEYTHFMLQLSFLSTR